MIYEKIMAKNLDSFFLIGYVRVSQLTHIIVSGACLRIRRNFDFRVDAELQLRLSVVWYEICII